MYNLNQNRYILTDINTSDNGKLLVLLYEGAIEFLQKSLKSIEAENILEKSVHINRALDIIQELQYSLDMKAGGDIARNLNSLYQFMFMHLMKAKISKDHALSGKHVKDIIAMLRTLHEGWKIAVSNPEAKKVLFRNESDLAQRTRGITV